MKISLSTLLTDEQENRLMQLCPHWPAAPAQTLIAIYNRANATYFGNRLVRPVITMKRFPSSDPRSKYLAYWDQNFRDLNVDPRLFKMRRPVLLCQALVHEMCHQAVTDIDHVMFVQTDPVRKTHGTHWIRWMQHCKLPPEPVSETTETLPN